MKPPLDPYKPVPGHLAVVMMVDADKLISYVPADNIDEYAGNFARTCGVRAGDEADQRRQCALRTHIVGLLRGPDRIERWNNYANLGSLWLALNHYSPAVDLRRALADPALLDGGAFLSMGCSPDPEKADHWFFAVASTMRDGRAQLARMGAGQCVVDVTGALVAPARRSAGEWVEIIATTDEMPFTVERGSR